MSSRDLAQMGGSGAGGRPLRLPGAAVGVLALSLLVTLSGCASGPERSTAGSSAGSATAAVPADDLTRRIAEVEFGRQCAVTTLTFPAEADITTDLDTRLAAAGLTHAQWKDWHDALVDSPALVAQLTEVGAPGCPGA